MQLLYLVFLIFTLLYSIWKPHDQKGNLILSIISLLFCVVYTITRPLNELIINCIGLSFVTLSVLVRLRNSRF